MARPAKREEDKKENLSGWSVTGKYCREIEQFSTACRMTRSEGLDMMIGHALHDFDRARYLKERKADLLGEIEGIEIELGRIAEYDAQMRLLAQALFRRFIATHTDKRGKYKHDPVGLSDYIQNSVLPRCPGIKYDTAVEIFKATYEIITNEKMGADEDTLRQRFDELMGANKDAKDKGQGQAESPRGDGATQG